MRTENNADKNKQEQPKIRRGGFRLKKHFPKLSLLLIALVIGFSSVVTLFAPQSASAINTSASKAADDEWQIRSLILYRALGNCFANNRIQTNPISGQIDLSAVRSGDWFDATFGGSNPKPRVGPYFRGDVDDKNDADVQADCTIPGDIVNAAMSLWGLDKEDFLCNIGAERVTGQKGADCLSKTGAGGNFWYGDISIDNYRKYVQKAIYGKEGEEPALSKDAYWYSFYYKVFLNSCAWKRTPLTNPDDIKALNITADGTTGYKIKVAQPDGTTKDVYYSGGLTRTHNIATRPGGIESNTNLASVDAHCGNGGNIQIEERINHYAAAAALLMKNGQLQVPNDNTGIVDEEEGSSCSVEGGLGWLLCPLANLAAGLTDSLFVAVSAFLRVAPVNLSPNDNPLYSAWATMRTIANVAFVIVFLIIIFSQLSSLGITNYGVKKMLPRLVIAAILVNLSFYICAIAVDVSNIVGVSLQDVFSYIAHETASTVISDTDNWGSITTAVLSGGTTLVAAGVFASILTSGGLLAALAGLLPLLFGALFALIVAFLVLLARQALIIMAIVVAPLAFVAYLLPNTESWFKKWRDLFITLLALFPMMSIVFGGSQLAAVILRESSSATLAGGEDMIAFFLYIGSFAVQAIPFFITPVLIKLSSGILGRFAGLVNNPNKGPLDRARKWAEGKAENAQNRGYARKMRGEGLGSKGLFGSGARRRARRESISQGLTGQAKDAQSEYISKTIAPEKTALTGDARKDAKAGRIDAKNTARSTSLQRKMAGTTNTDAREKIQASAIRTQFGIENEEIEAGKSVLQAEKLTGGDTAKLAVNGTYADGRPVSKGVRRAAIQEILKRGNAEEQAMIMQAGAPGGSLHDDFRQTISNAMGENNANVAAKDPAMTGKAIADMLEGNFNYDQARRDAFAKGRYNAGALATMDNGKRAELLAFVQAAADGGDDSMLRSLQASAEGIDASAEVRSNVVGDDTRTAQIESLLGGRKLGSNSAGATVASAPTAASPTSAIPLPGANPFPSPLNPVVLNPTAPASPPPTFEVPPYEVPPYQVPPAPSIPPAPTPPNFFADQQPTPPANNDPTSLGYWQSPPPVPTDPMRPPTTPPPTDGTNDRDTP